MPRDYKHAEVFSSSTKPLPAWIWLFALAAISGFVGLIYYLEQYDQEKTDVQHSDVSEITKPKSSSGNQSIIPETQDDIGLEKRAEQDVDDKSRFDFYRLLPQLRVDVPENKVIPRRVPPTLPGDDSKEKPENNSLETPGELPEQTPGLFQYILQAGSFKDHREADRLKASLALLGIIAKIESVVLNRSETWHRVRIGPISNEREMNKIRNRLRGQHIEPVMLKVKT
ncbi:MAG: hypothetical protein GXP08_08315 [Gammaproteobacteria bacterium]|nr:hypothetical protein [Gammaproteobacteria bacterium]